MEIQCQIEITNGNDFQGLKAVNLKSIYLNSVPECLKVKVTFVGNSNTAQKNCD